ncbi:MAG: undecaprenyldiphospho-muramoylpentapeptide beta-N-acetylglucosaminyltransferase [Clostridia bacterium]|nr:undecaprenyldiphospho-muramoylpentapeptide beta-N-acetylglucosaminyltransferase [Clostridia bacterium]
MKILFTGGGTGGHVNPALAIAHTFKKRQPTVQIAFVGTPNGIENKLVSKAGYPMHHINIQGLKRSLSPSNFKTLYLTLTSVSKAKKLLKKERPDCVIGTGGYVCYPLVKAASKLGIPTAIHESNAIPGIAIKLLSPCVDMIFTDFEKTAEYIKKQYRDKIVHVGNPYFENDDDITYESAREKLGISGKYDHSILVYGGSLGASNINSNVVKWAAKRLKDNKRIKLTHATGARGYEITVSEYNANGLGASDNIEILEYIYDMPVRMAAADVIVCRAGAMTLSELAMAGKPAILVPYPYAAENHQYKNAMVLQNAGAAVLIEDSALDENGLDEAISSVLNGKGKEMSEKIKQFAMPDANEMIYENILKLINKNKAD